MSMASCFSMLSLYQIWSGKYGLRPISKDKAKESEGYTCASSRPYSLMFIIFKPQTCNVQSIMLGIFPHLMLSTVSNFQPAHHHQFVIWVSILDKATTPCSFFCIWRHWHHHCAHFLSLDDRSPKYILFSSFIHVDM